MQATTGIAFMDVEPFPRMKLMKLYYLTLQEIKDLPDIYQYKFLSQELTRFRMKVVDEHLSVRAIEEKISHGSIEELIFQAHNEIKLLRIMKKWRPWEHLFSNDEEHKETLAGYMNFHNEEIDPQQQENSEGQKHTANPRRPSASVHPEDH